MFYTYKILFYSKCKKNCLLKSHLVVLCFLRKFFEADL
jgi:hypothetical protein